MSHDASQVSSPDRRALVSYLSNLRGSVVVVELNDGTSYEAVYSKYAFADNKRKINHVLKQAQKLPPKPDSGRNTNPFISEFQVDGDKLVSIQARQLALKHEPRRTGEGVAGFGKERELVAFFGATEAEESLEVLEDAEGGGKWDQFATHAKMEGTKPIKEFNFNDYTTPIDPEFYKKHEKEAARIAQDIETSGTHDEGELEDNSCVTRTDEPESAGPKSDAPRTTTPRNERGKAGARHAGQGTSRSKKDKAATQHQAAPRGEPSVLLRQGSQERASKAPEQTGVPVASTSKYVPPFRRGITATDNAKAVVSSPDLPNGRDGPPIASIVSPPTSPALGASPPVASTTSPTSPTSAASASSSFSSPSPSSRSASNTSPPITATPPALSTALPANSSSVSALTPSRFPSASPIFVSTSSSATSTTASPGLASTPSSPSPPLSTASTPKAAPGASAASWKFKLNPNARAYAALDANVPEFVPSETPEVVEYPGSPTLPPSPPTPQFVPAQYAGYSPPVYSPSYSYQSVGFTPSAPPPSIALPEVVIAQSHPGHPHFISPQLQPHLRTKPPTVISTSPRPVVVQEAYSPHLEPNPWPQPIVEVQRNPRYVTASPQPALLPQHYRHPQHRILTMQMPNL